MSDCRTQARYFLSNPIVKNATLTVGNVIYRVDIVNISKGGMFVKLPRTMAVGAEVRLAVALPGTVGRCHIPCSVRWTREDNGVGLKFLSLKESEAGGLRLLIRMLQML